MKRDESGFFLLETLVAGAALLVMSACLYFFAHSMELRGADDCRMRAVFMARTQFAAAQAAADCNALVPGEFPWQGEGDELSAGGNAYSVETHIEGSGRGIYRVSVQIHWQGRDRDGGLNLEREVVAHEKGTAD
ncbi:MAG: hypothetical protein E7200_11025 [Selenomonas ruminantium]|nr:hypothetical protein [Selenomonas ruminantium]